MDLSERYIKAKRALFDKYYGDLNEMQRKAVYQVDGPLLVLAGAGSGKTTVLTKRIAYLIKYGNAYNDVSVPFDLDESKVEDIENAINLSNENIENVLPLFSSNACAPYNILAITFTNKAADEIKSRVVTAIGNEDIANQIWSGTFHKICLRILRNYCDKLGYQKDFSIYDTDDSKKLVLSCMKDLNIDNKTLSEKTVMNYIGRAKDKLMTPGDFLDEIGSDYRLKKIGEIYSLYQQKLKASNAFDFDDIIMQTVTLLRQYKEVREYYASKFKYVLIDEYQDTNEAQFELGKLLSMQYRNLFVVGDDDQSIYKFRGATIENILGFDKVYNDAKIIKLEQNYRSTNIILNCANAVISHNVGRKGKNLWTSSDGGDKISLDEYDDAIDESKMIAAKINNLVAKGNEYKDFAVLYRNNAQSQSIERTFAKGGIPYRIVGGVRFADRKEIKDIVAYLQIIENRGDDLRLLRIINEPKRKIGDKTIDGIRGLAVENNCTMFEIMENADKYVALKNSAKTLVEFANLINYLSKMSKDCTLEALVNNTIDRSGYRQMLIDAGEEEKDRLENIEEFVSGAIEFDAQYEANLEEYENQSRLTAFLAENMLVADVDRYDENADAVVLMTIHSAKGLEFPYVFLPGMEEGIFPSMQSSNSEAEIEEERRLCYVAITRAKKALFVSHARQRMLYGRTSFNPISRFVEEMPKELLQEKQKSYKRNEQTYRSYMPKTFGFADDLTVTPKKRPMETTLEQLNVGDRVLHQTFGEGEIISAKKMGADYLYEIIFDNFGTKKLMASFAKLRKV